MSGQVLIHPSHICQIGESDQGLIVWPIRIDIPSHTDRAALVPFVCRRRQ